MHKFLICFLMLTIFSTLEFAQADVWPEAAKMFSGKKPSTTGCFDFSKPVQIKQPKGHYYAREPKQKSKPVTACAPELSKRIDKYLEEYKELKKDTKNKITEAKKSALDTSIIETVDYHAASNAIGFDINICLDRFLFDHVDGSKPAAKEKLKDLQEEIAATDSDSKKKQIASRYVYENLLAKKNLTQEEKDRVNTLLISTGDLWDILKKQGLKKNNDKQVSDPYLKARYLEETNNILKKSIGSYKESPIFHYQGKQNYRSSEKDNLVAFLLKDDKQKLRSIISKSSTLCKDLYLKNTPSVIAADAKEKSKGKLIGELRHAKKELCESGAEINKCPTYKEEFLEAIRSGKPVEELQGKFENMITLVDSLNFMENDANYNDTVTVFNFEEYKTKIRKGTIEVNERRKDLLKTHYKKSSTAYENYLENVEAAKSQDNTNGFKPVNASCGGCSVLKQAFREAEKTQDYNRINELYKLDQSIGCNIIKAKSCSEAVNKSLRNNQFDELENKTISFDGVFEKLERNPNQYQDKVQNLMQEVFKVIDPETSKPCAKCNELDKRLQNVSEFIEGKYSLKEGADKGYYNSLKDIALELNCLSPNDFTPVKENSCDDYSNYFKGLTLYYGSLNELSAVQSSEKDQKLNELNKYQKTKNISCCDEIIHYDKEMNGIQYIKKDNIQVQLAEAMQCLRCEAKEKPDNAAKIEMAKGNETSCKWFKDTIANKLTSAKIDGLYLPVMTSDGEGQRNYTIEDFKKYEIYTCSDGPAKSHIRTPNAWETKAYAPNGKYGSVFDYGLKCFVDPRTKQSVNLTCCNETADTPLYKELHSHVKNSPLNSQDFVTDLKFNPATIKSLNNDLADGKANTFCNHVIAGYQNKKGNQANQSMNICYDHNDNVVYKVDELENTNWNSSEQKSVIPSKAKQE